VHRGEPHLAAITHKQKNNTQLQPIDRERRRAAEDRRQKKRVHVMRGNGKKKRPHKRQSDPHGANQ